MDYPLQALLSLVLLGFAPMASRAIIVRHDRDIKLFVELGREFPSTVMLRHVNSADGYGGEGTLIAPGWVLTAAHVANDLGPGDPVTVKGQVHTIRRVVLYPDWHQDADMPIDVALVELKEPVADVDPARIYSDSDEQGMIATVVGRGQQGTGLTGATAKEGLIMAATNRVESTLDVFPGTDARGQYPAEGLQLRFKFDAPGTPHVTELEGISGGGDSGGPAYIKRDGVLYVIGVSSGQDRRHLKVGRYGVFEYYVRVSHFAGWIRSVIGN